MILYHVNEPGMFSYFNMDPPGGVHIVNISKVRGEVAHFHHSPDPIATTAESPDPSPVCPVSIHMAKSDTTKIPIQHPMVCSKTPGQSHGLSEFIASNGR